MNYTLITFVFLYLLSNIGIGWWASQKVKTAQDFALAGRQLPVYLASTAIFATWFGSETVLGATSEFVQYGLIGVIKDPFGAFLCLILTATFFTRPLYRMKLLTFNDYFKVRYNERVELVSAISLVPSYFGWVAGQLVAMAIILKALIGLPLFWGIVVCALVVVIYTYIGGMWAVSITDFVQTIFILIGLFALLIVIIPKAGGLSKVFAQTPPDFFRIYPQPTLSDWLQYIVAWMTLGLGGIPQQDVFQRVMSSKTERGAVIATYIGAVMYLTIAFIPLLIALCGKMMYPDLMKGDTQMLLPQLVLQNFGILMQILFFGSLLSAILSTTSGAILAPAVVLTENIVKYFYPEMTDKQMLRMMRFSVLLIAVGSALMASSKSSIYELVALTSALLLVSLFVPFVLGLYWHKASNLGALLSIILGMTVWIVGEIYVFQIPSLILGFFASFLGMLIGVWISPNQENKMGLASQLNKLVEKS